MPVETGTTLAELDDQWPLSNDVLIEGDNHIRLIKSILKDQFPGELGEGLAAVVAATEAEFSYLVGVTSSIQDQLDAITTNLTDRIPIGHIVISVHPNDPSTYGYPGNWALVDDDCVLSTGGSAGEYLGDNEQLVPLTEHTHLAAFEGEEIEIHQHDSGFGSRYDNGEGQFKFGITPDPDFTGITYEHHQSRTDLGTGYTDPVTAGTPAGEVTVENAGTLDVTMDVRGKSYNVYIWERIA